MPNPDEPTPSIVEWAGGPAALRRWLGVFYDLVEQEPDIAALFGGHVSEAHREHVTAWWVEVMGGPAEYTERHGGYEHMLAKHVDLGITDDQRLRFVTLLSLAADQAELPADPEFRAAIMGYAEWGSRLAVHNSHPALTPCLARPFHGGAGALRRPTRDRRLGLVTPAPGEVAYPTMR